MINPDALNAQLNGKISENQRHMIAICALDHIWKLLGFCKIENPYTSGKKQYEIEYINILINRMHCNIPHVAKIATSRLLDWYFPEWKNFVSKEISGQLITRRDSRVKKWAKYVLSRDGNRCSVCNSTKNLQAHHILSWADNPGSRIDLENGITLCGLCHHKAHATMGAGMFIKNKRND